MTLSVLTHNCSTGEREYSEQLGGLFVRSSNTAVKTNCILSVKQVSPDKNELIPSRPARPA